MIRQGGLGPFDDPDDIVGNRVEGPRDDGYARSGLDPFRHFLRRILREGQK